MAGASLVNLWKRVGQPNSVKLEPKGLAISQSLRMSNQFKKSSKNSLLSNEIFGGYKTLRYIQYRRSCATKRSSAAVWNAKSHSSLAGELSL